MPPSRRLASRSRAPKISMRSSLRPSSRASAKQRAGRPTRCSLAAFLSACLLVSCAWAPASAFADVRKSDIIYGQSMEERGIKATSSPNLGCEYAYVCSADGTEYFARDADAPVQIASITKVMTAIVALESSDLEREVTVSQAAATVGESSADLKAGDVLTMENALKGLMVPSGNDAAIAIAECLGADFQRASKDSGETLHRSDGSAIDNDDPASALDAFVAKMNEKARELGCTDTVFTNPHGLDYGQFAGDLHSTAREVSKICAYAMRDERFRALTDIPSVGIPVKRGGEEVTVELETTDLLLGKYEGACGIKTGNTELAGPCFAGACNRDGADLYAIVLDSSSDEQRFIDCKTLFDWVYGNQVDHELAHSPETAQMKVDGQERDVPVVARVALSGWVDKTVKATFADPDETVRIFAPHGNVSQRFEFDELGGGVSTGQVVGRATFYQDNEEIAQAELVACEDVAGPNPLEAIGIWWDKLARTFSGQPTSAQSVIINETPLVLEKD